MIVPHLSAELTRAALTAVAALTRDLGARASLIAAQIVPFPLPLDRPDVPPGFLQQELAALAEELDTPVDVNIVMARDREAGIAQAVPPGSLVIVAFRKRWWPTPQEKLARTLAQAGHGVALLEVLR